MIYFQSLCAFLVIWFLIADVLFPLIRFFFFKKPVMEVKGLADDSGRTVDGEVVFK